MCRTKLRHGASRWELPRRRTACQGASTRQGVWRAVHQLFAEVSDEDEDHGRNCSKGCAPVCPREKNIWRRGMESTKTKDMVSDEEDQVDEDMSSDEDLDAISFPSPVAKAEQHHGSLPPLKDQPSSTERHWYAAPKAGYRNVHQLLKKFEKDRWLLYAKGRLVKDQRDAIPAPQQHYHVYPVPTAFDTNSGRYTPRHLRDAWDDTWSPENGILLLSHLHELFDTRLFSIHPDILRIRAFVPYDVISEHHGSIAQHELGGGQARRNGDLVALSMVSCGLTRNSQPWPLRRRQLIFNSTSPGGGNVILNSFLCSLIGSKAGHCYRVGAICGPSLFECSFEAPHCFMYP